MSAKTTLSIFLAVLLLGNSAVAADTEGAQDVSIEPAPQSQKGEASTGFKNDTRWLPNGTRFLDAGFVPPPPPSGGFQFVATTTQYGTNPATSCGVDSAALVAGTDFLPVASAQAMQSGCCTCNGNGGGGGAASLGCGTCARGRFIRSLPRGFHIWTPPSAAIFHKEFNLVVADLCPHSGNANWCPAQAGQTNTYGALNHFDFAIVPDKFDNFYFEFSPMECPEVLKQRMRQSKCATGAWR